MVQALFYAPSYARLQDAIQKIAPSLDVALLDEEGHLLHKGQVVQAEDLQPEWFWLHMELFMQPARRAQYFELIQQAAQPRWLHTVNTGLDGLPYLDIFRRGVSLTNNHSQSIAIAEYVLAHVLAHYQNVSRLRQQQAEKRWEYRRFREIHGARWLLIGFGAIAQDVARRAKAFGASIATLRRQADGQGLAETVYTRREQLPEALSEADVVVLSCASNEETRGLVDDAFLVAMKPRSVLVNIARGDLVDEKALLTALNHGTPELAILDVLNQEPPPPEHWAWEHPSVVLTPHSSNAGDGMGARSDALFLENLRRQVAGEPLLNPVTERDFF